MGVPLPLDKKAVLKGRARAKGAPDRPDIKTSESIVMRNQTLDKPILGIENDFPSVVFVLKHPPSQKYGCYCFEGVHGLACFSDEGSAFRFAEWLDLSGMEAEEVPFDEAREIAKDRPMPIVSVMLLDNLSEPQIHYVR
jgi:hypothetical protein